MAINRSQIPALLLPGLAALTGKYPQLPARYREFMAVATTKMAVERSVEMRYSGLAQLKAEGSATTFDNSPGQRFTYNALVQSVGLGFAQTRESLDDNLYKDQFGPQSMGLARAFLQTKDIFCANLLNTAATYNPNIGGDLQPLASTAHPIDNGSYGNTPTVQMDFNESSVEAALNAVRVFPDQAGLISYTRGRKLLVPVALQWAAERLTKTELRSGTGDNDVSAIFSTGAIPEGYAVNEFLTSQFGWFLLTDVEGLVLYERTPFEMDLQVDPVTGNLLCIGYERYAPSYRDPRAIYSNMPTA